MTDEELESIKRMVARQTFINHSHFDNLISHKNDNPLSVEFIDKWVKPFYMKLNDSDQNLVDELSKIKNEITDDIISKMLGDDNYRSRQVGAYFAAITNRQNFIDIIGIHLLKSEVTYACKIYLLVFASFNNKECIDYIEIYLNYYLKKPDLYFDQREALESIVYLDKVNSTNLFSNYQNLWTKFIEDKPFWKKEINIENFEKKILALEKIKK